MHKGLVAFLALSLMLGTAPAADADGESDDQAYEIVQRYNQNLAAQAENLRGVEMEVQIQANLPKLHKSGKMNALRMISKVGKVSYKMLGFSGDATIKNDVIARYLTAETQAQGNGASMAITPENYKFKLKGSITQDTRKSYILELKPRQKRVGLFKGELWVDAQTYLPVRQTGAFVKNPSVFLKKVEFTQTYDIQDGVSLPKHIESTIDTRIVGKADISIDFSAPKPAEQEKAAPVEEARFR